MLAVILVLDFCNIYSILIQLNLVYTLEESDQISTHFADQLRPTYFRHKWRYGYKVLLLLLVITGSKSPKLVSLCKLDQSLPSCTISKWLYKCNVLNNHIINLTVSVDVKHHVYLLNNHSRVFAATSQPNIFIREKFHMDHDCEVVIKCIHHMSVTCISFGSEL